MYIYIYEIPIRAEATSSLSTHLVSNFFIMPWTWNNWTNLTYAKMQKCPQSKVPRDQTRVKFKETSHEELLSFVISVDHMWRCLKLSNPIPFHGLSSFWTVLQWQNHGLVRSSAKKKEFEILIKSVPSGCHASHSLKQPSTSYGEEQFTLSWPGANCQVLESKPLNFGNEEEPGESSHRTFPRLTT